MDRTRKRDGHTDGRTDSAITICLPKFLWGHKNKGARVVTTLFIDSSRAANSVVGDGILTTFKLIGALWLSLLPARMKKIHPKMKVPDWSQHFSHFKSMENFPDTQWQLTPQSKVGSCRILNPYEILWLSLLPAR